MSANDREVKFGAENSPLAQTAHEIKETPPHLISCTNDTNKIEQSNSDQSMKCDGIINDGINLPKVSLSSSYSSSTSRISRASSISSSTKSETYKPPFLRHVMGLTQEERALLTGWQSMNVLSTTRKMTHEMETQKEKREEVVPVASIESTIEVQETNEENDKDRINSSLQSTSRSHAPFASKSEIMQKGNNTSNNSNNSNEKENKEKETIAVDRVCTDLAVTEPVITEYVASTDNSSYSNIINDNSNNNSSNNIINHSNNTSVGDVVKSKAETLQVKKPSVTNILRKQIRRSLSVPSLRNNTNYHVQQQQQRQHQRQHQHQHYYVHNYCKPARLFLHQVSCELPQSSVVSEKAEELSQEPHHELQKHEEHEEKKHLERETCAAEANVEAVNRQSEKLLNNVLNNDIAHNASIVEETKANNYLNEEKQMNTNAKEVLKGTLTSMSSISEALSDVVNDQISFAEQQQEQQEEKAEEQEQIMQSKFTDKSQEVETKVENIVQNLTVPTLYNDHHFASYAAQNTLPPTDNNNNNNHHLHFSGNSNNNVFYTNSNFSNTPIMNSFSSPSTCTPASNTIQPNMHVFNYSNIIGNYNNINNNIGSPSAVPQLSPTLVNSPVSPIALSSEASIPFYDFITVLPYYIETCLLLHERDHTCRENLFRNIQAITKKALSSHAELRVHGSVVTNLALPSSDIDLLVMYYEPLNPLEALQALASALLAADDVALAEACRYVSETLTAAAQASAMSKQSEISITEHNTEKTEDGVVSDNTAEQCSGIYRKNENNHERKEQETTTQLTRGKEIEQKSDNLDANKGIGKQEEVEEKEQLVEACNSNVNSIDLGEKVTKFVNNSNVGIGFNNDSVTVLEELPSLPEIQLTSMTTPTLVNVDSENQFSSVQSKHSVHAHSTTIGADEEYVNEAELECAEEVYRDQIEKDYSFSTPCELSSIFAKVNVVHHAHPHSSELLSASFTTKSNMTGNSVTNETNKKRKNILIRKKKEKKMKDIKVEIQTSNSENRNGSNSAAGDHIRMNDNTANDNDYANTMDESTSSVYYSPLIANSSSRYEREVQEDNSQSEESQENEHEYGSQEDINEREDIVHVIRNNSSDVKCTRSAHLHYNEMLASDFPVTGSVLLAVTSRQPQLQTSSSSPTSSSSAPLLLQSKEVEFQFEEREVEMSKEPAMRLRRSVGTNTNSAEEIEQSNTNNNSNESEVSCNEEMQAPQKEIDKEEMQEKEVKEKITVSEMNNVDKDNITSSVNVTQNVQPPTNNTNTMNNTVYVNTTSTPTAIPLLTEQYHGHPYQPIGLYQHHQQQPLEIPLLHSISHDTFHKGNSLPYYSYVPTREGPLFEVQAITSTRVPVIKITERATNLRADITFAGGEHWRSMQFTRELLRLYPHARGLILFLKHCIKCLEIGENKIGGVTSFALYLMVRHFFNECTSRIVCILREQEVEKERNALFVNKNSENKNMTMNINKKTNSDSVNHHATQNTEAKNNNNNNNMYSAHHPMYYANSNAQTEQTVQTQQPSSSSSHLHTSNTSIINNNNNNSSSPLSSVTMSVLESLVHGYLSRVSERYTFCEGNKGEFQTDCPINHNNGESNSNTIDNATNSKTIYLRGNTQLRPVEEAILGYLGFSHDAIVAGNRDELFTSPIAMEPLAMNENECNSVRHELEESECAAKTKGELVNNAVGPVVRSSSSSSLSSSVQRNVKTASNNDNNINSMHLHGDKGHLNVNTAEFTYSENEKHNEEETKIASVEQQEQRLTTISKVKEEEKRTEEEPLHELLQQEEQEKLENDKLDDSEGNKAKLLRNFAIDFLRHRVGISQIFCDFCHYYGCAFNYETDGIQFDGDGSSRVIAKPYMCVVRGQYFHLTSPFDPEYDITARMTCMRDFQWLCWWFANYAMPPLTMYFAQPTMHSLRSAMPLSSSETLSPMAMTMNHTNIYSPLSNNYGMMTVNNNNLINCNNNNTMADIHGTNHGVTVGVNVNTMNVQTGYDPYATSLYSYQTSLTPEMNYSGCSLQTILEWLSPSTAEANLQAVHCRIVEKYQREQIEAQKKYEYEQLKHMQEMNNNNNNNRKNGKEQENAKWRSKQQEKYLEGEQQTELNEKEEVEIHNSPQIKATNSNQITSCHTGDNNIIATENHSVHSSSRENSANTDNVVHDNSRIVYNTTNANGTNVNDNNREKENVCMESASGLTAITFEFTSHSPLLSEQKTKSSLQTEQAVTHAEESSIPLETSESSTNVQHIVQTYNCRGNVNSCNETELKQKEESEKQVMINQNSSNNTTSNDIINMKVENGTEDNHSQERINKYENEEQLVCLSYHVKTNSKESSSSVSTSNEKESFTSVNNSTNLCKRHDELEYLQEAENNSSTLMSEPSTVETCELEQKAQLDAELPLLQNNNASNSTNIITTNLNVISYYQPPLPQSSNNFNPYMAANPAQLGVTALPEKLEQKEQQQSLGNTANINILIPNNSNNNVEIKSEANKDESVKQTCLAENTLIEQANMLSQVDVNANTQLQYHTSENGNNNSNNNTISNNVLSYPQIGVNTTASLESSGVNHQYIHSAYPYHGSYPYYSYPQVLQIQPNMTSMINYHHPQANALQHSSSSISSSSAQFLPPPPFLPPPTGATTTTAAASVFPLPMELVSQSQSMLQPPLLPPPLLPPPPPPPPPLLAPSFLSQSNAVPLAFTSISPYSVPQPQPQQQQQQPHNFYNNTNGNMTYSNSNTPTNSYNRYYHQGMPVSNMMYNANANQNYNHSSNNMYTSFYNAVNGSVQNNSNINSSKLHNMNNNKIVFENRVANWNTSRQFATHRGNTSNNSNIIINNLTPSMQLQDKLLQEALHQSRQQQ